MTKKPLKVAMIAPPWLAIPTKGYGGIELVIESLVDLLRKQGVEVELFGNGARSMKGVKTRSLYKKDMFDKIDWPYYDAPLQVMQSHMHFALDYIEKKGDFDIIHDHNPYIGPSFLSLATRIDSVPPALHTFHGPPFSTDAEIAAGKEDNRTQLSLMPDSGKFYMTCISDTQKAQAPNKVSSRMLDTVYNAIELDLFPFVEKKKDYYITLARFTPEKGQHIAAKFAAKYRKRLHMAGTVAGIDTKRKLFLELSNPLSKYRQNKEFVYYSDKVLQYVLRYPKINFMGNIGGTKKYEFIGKAKALLFPIQWEEPFGMAVIEALACGTPVVAMRRGAMPEIIQHGVNGFLADTEQEFFDYANRVDEINPADCRRSVEEKFSATVMAQAYIDRYNQVIELASSKK